MIRFLHNHSYIKRGRQAKGAAEQPKGAAEQLKGAAAAMKLKRDFHGGTSDVERGRRSNTEVIRQTRRLGNTTEREKEE